ncbi:nucleotide sugar dehydrogenase [Candidatus Parcubacteria bacterium]|nr:MAG: nucleotide sugar dehydrogenase [Candidatus Parcubacteria bacterium]
MASNMQAHKIIPAHKLRSNNIVVVGLGYVGLPLALLAKKNGYNVSGIVRSKYKADLINKKICPFEDKSISRELKQHFISATVDFSIIKDADIVIICVPTPVDGYHKPDLEPIITTSKNIGINLKKGTLIILESTVNPGTIREQVIPLLERESKLIAGKDFYIAHCPERINPGDTTWNVKNISRIVGGFDDKSLERAVRFYKSIISAKIKPMQSIEEAEAVKIVENCFRDINIAFVNELAISFSLLGIDVVNVIEGASTKPFSFLPHYPGCGVGGHCIPVDPYYMIEYASGKGFSHRFLSLARQINNDMPLYTANLAINELENQGKNLKNSTVTVLGISYKKNIDDFRESTSFKIIESLKKRGINVKSYDPHVLDKSTAKNLDEALNNADAIILATDHDEFLTLTPEYLLENNINILIDGRNCFNGEQFIKAGIYYKGIGR